ncbi:MAG: hypothetical protein HRT61_21180 [Ekhidna sp.]|nr:hypothetical protein [Ekhidna sp.]
MGLLSNYFRHSPYGRGAGYYKGYYAERASTTYSDIKAYKSLCDSMECKNNLHTEASISLQDFKFSQSPLEKEIVEIFGKPKDKIKVRLDNENIFIILYKHTIGGYRVRSEFHFCQNQLFYFNHHFNHLNYSERDKVLETMKEKYHIRKSWDTRTEYIQHTNGSYAIDVEDSIGIKINYFLYSDNGFFARLQKIVAEDERREKRLNKWKVGDLYAKI